MTESEQTMSQNDASRYDVQALAVALLGEFDPSHEGDA
jgi:hypothetical protein